MKLWELAEQWQSLTALETTEDVPPEVLRDTLEGLEGEFALKAEAVAMYVLNLEAAAEAKAALAKSIKARADQLSARAASLRAYLQFQLQATGHARIETDTLVLRLQNNPPSVVIDDEAVVPAEFKVQPPAPPPRPDKKLISLAFKAGVEVPGCHPESGQSLRIEV